MGQWSTMPVPTARHGRGETSGTVLGNDHWRRVATAARLEDVQEAILTGYLDGKPFWPYAPVLEMPGPLDRILDFGCGLGRNFPYLRSVANRVVGFDLPEMIERCRCESLPDRVELVSDWHQVRRQRFDCVFACHVLQHIEPEALLSTYIPDFATIAPWTYVLSRGRSDFGGGVFGLIAATGALSGSICNVVEHDPVTHGLKLCNTVPAKEASLLADNRHYEMLLAPRCTTR